MLDSSSSGKSRRAARWWLFGSALPVAALLVSGRLIAADAINSASLVLPAGTVDSNLTNNTVTLSIPVNALIVAIADSAGSVNGLTGASDVLNVLNGDTINGQPATTTNAVLSVAPGSAVPAGLVFDTATGGVSVSPQTPAGTYTFDYTICEAARPGNCKTASVSITVIPAVLSVLGDTLPAPISSNGGVGVINVFANDTLNGTPISPATITATVTTPATSINGSLVPVLDPMTGLVSVPAGTPVGTYTIGYLVCEKLNPTNCAIGTVTLVIDAARSNLSGTVYLDVNGDHNLDVGDIRKPGWIVEVLLGGKVVATTSSDASGNYLFKDLMSGPGYEVRFRNPDNNVVYGILSGITLGSNQTVVDENLPIDPAGVVYDSVTRSPVAGATMILADAAGNPLPVACFIDPSQQSQVTGASGQYRFDVVPGAASQCSLGETVYLLKVIPPAGYSFVSTVLTPRSGPLDPTGAASPYRVSPSVDPPTGSDAPYYLSFRLSSGDPHVINNHLPLDPFLTRAQLVVTKTSTKRSASTGDLVPYEITVRNNENVQRAGVDVVDVLPPGMKYVPGSATVEGLNSEPATKNDNRELVWHSQVIPANGSVRYNLTLIVGAGVTSGERINTGLAENGPNGVEISNRGTASITIAPSSVFDCSELLGKVFEDTNRNGYQDEGEPGVPGARLATVNGQLVTTDQFGRYHVACPAVPDSRIGSNFVLKLDLRTVPLGWEATTDNPRSIRLTRGKSSELNFGVAPPARENASTVRKEGE